MSQGGLKSGAEWVVGQVGAGGKAHSMVNVVQQEQIGD